MVRIMASFAMALDGSIADYRGQWRPLCKYELERYLRTVDEHEAIIVGSDTVIHSGLSFEPRIAKARFLKILLDPKLEVPFEHPFYKRKNRFTKIMTFYSSYYKSRDLPENTPEEKVKLVGFKGKQANPKSIIEHLKGLGITNAALVGGGKILASFLKNKNVDLLRVTVTPLVMGRGIPLVNRVVSRFPGYSLRLEKIDVCPCGQEVVLYYRPETDPKTPNVD